MDGIQPYAGGPRPPRRHRPRRPAAVRPAAVKTPSDYLRALRRRIWLVLAVGVPLARAGALYVLRLPAGLPRQGRDRDQAAGVSTRCSRRWSRTTIGRRDAEPTEKYVPDTASRMLKSKSLAEKVVNDPALGLPAQPSRGRRGRAVRPSSSSPDPAVATASSSPSKARDPARITRTAELPARQVPASRPTDESRDASEQAQSQARRR